MEIRVLGSLEIIGTDGPVSIGAGKPRRLLAALAIRAGEALPSDVLIDAVWGASPPASATKLLQVYVSQLRKALASPVRIQTRGASYALELGDDALDAARFERLLSDGRAAALDGNATLAASLLRRALGLWRGPAYGELRYEQFAHGEAERLEELRLVALEEQIEAELALGQHDDVQPGCRASRPPTRCASACRRRRCSPSTAADGKQKHSRYTPGCERGCATSWGSSPAASYGSCSGGSSNRARLLPSRSPSRGLEPGCRRRRTRSWAASASWQSCATWSFATMCGCSS